MLEWNKTYNVDCRKGVKMLPDHSIDCIVTSPPYYGLRDYGVEGQIGLEETPQQYIDRLVELFHELRRALKNTGTVWVNIGDTMQEAAEVREIPNEAPTSSEVTQQVIQEI